MWENYQQIQIRQIQYQKRITSRYRSSTKRKSMKNMSVGEHDLQTSAKMIKTKTRKDRLRRSTTTSKNKETRIRPANLPDDDFTFKSHQWVFWRPM